jgi:hypothetical protein
MNHILKLLQHVSDDTGSKTFWSNFNLWFVLEFYITQIVISTTSIFECISRLIKVTDNNDARRKLEIAALHFHFSFLNVLVLSTEDWIKTTEHVFM